MNRDELLNRLNSDITGYLKQGILSKQQFASSVKLKDLPDRFNDYQRLMDLHFILDDSVVDFVKALSHRVRRVKTQTKRLRKETKGRVEGRIAWEQTLRRRYATNPSDRTLFVTESNQQDYDLDENIVLKRLLSIIYHTLEEAETFIEKEYEWITKEWKNNHDLVDELRAVFKRNVHITRIREPEAYEPTDRMIETALQSRQNLYREAGKLLQRRQRMHEGHEDELRDVLENTAITPDDTETLFELYVVFRFIATLEQLQDDQFTLDPIERDQQRLAQLQGDDVDLVLYHDKSASEQNLSFLYGKDDIEEPKKRPERVQEKTHEVIEDYFGSDAEASGRPDVLVLEIDDGETSEYVVCEVKYSTNKKTIREGVKECLEYMAFLKHKDEWVNPDENVFNEHTEGLVIVDDADTISEPDVNHPLRILTAQDITDQNPALENFLKDILDRGGIVR